MMLKKILSVVLVIFLVGVVFISVAGCEKEEGPLEKAGEKMDEAVEEAKDKAEDVADKVEDKAEDVKKKVNE